MRYLKYKKANKTEKNAEKQRYKNLSEKEKRAYRKEKILRALGMIVLFLVMGACMIALSLCIKTIPSSKNVFIDILIVLIKGILYFFAGVFSIVAGVLASIPLFNMADKNTRNFTREELVKACEHLREYYGLCDPCIVTKCYTSSEKRFNNHDVCIFVVGDELRITANLKDGFFHSEKDLGCYCFTADEITVSKVEGEKFLIARLSVQDIYFELGYRAKGFVERNFTEKE